ncbi:PhnA domain protein [Hahella sp. CCB-MM4]|uniref:PhnA domain-containing protein n=1 Tax=Hahella sp. (strain CCB-MM4) TaxID=1926491 RepID=UPI000B9B1F81|nr:alkylphosphonate utilization protein [Hahella sp. CCB-MM4]OZG75380.1 PhnA domain protein [Hahella sp. CCB-MM4]
MTTEAELNARCNGQCELCGSDQSLGVYSLTASGDRTDIEIMICGVCNDQVSSGELDTNHWHCLTSSMWSEVPAVQVMAYRLLKQLSSEPWAQDLLDMLYLEDDMKAWAEAGIQSESEDQIVHKDCHGNILQAGDSVTIVKDLDVKGTSFVAKRGTVVKGISLTDNPEHIEGRVNGTRIVILTQYVKKS